jgi:hypothetical protein
MGTALGTGLGVVVAAVGVRVLIAAVVAMADTARQLLVERARRRTLLTVTRAVSEASMLVDERPDGSKLTVRVGAAVPGPGGGGHR